MASISRGFVDVFGTSMHVRWSGQGVPLLLIHQSPTSARVLEHRLLAFGDRYLCIAPDIPGMGQSGRIGEPVPSIELLAKYFIGFLDRTGIQRVLLFGAHTGALICTHMALTRPDRVAGIILDGYPIYTLEELSQRLASYFPPLSVSWEGAHLVWLWYRYREQFIYWPWNTKRAGMRASASIPTPRHLHAGVAEMARTHDTYPSCYAAAFSYDAATALRDLTVEAHFLAGDADLLTRKLSLWEPKPGLHTVHKVAEGTRIATERQVLDDLVARNPALMTLDKFPDTPDLSTRGYACARSGHSVATRCVRGDGRPVVILPPIPASTDFVVSMPDAETTGRNLILVDPPGIGGVPHGPMQACVEAIAAALANTGAGRADVVAFGYSAALLPALHTALGNAVGQVIAVDAPLDRELPAPFDATLCPSGGHLLRWWDRWRFEKLFSPSSAHSAAAIRSGAAEDLATLGRFILCSLDALPHWPTIEAELAPNLRGAWTKTLGPSDVLLFSEIDSATSTALAETGTPARVVNLSLTGQSVFGWLRYAGHT